MTGGLFRYTIRMITKDNNKNIFILVELILNISMIRPNEVRDHVMMLLYDFFHSLV